jgi:SAM-dependent methyltransferase
MPMNDRALDHLETVHRRYGHPAIVEKFASRHKDGLLIWEETVWKAFHAGGGSAVLDLGCGAGREAFALADRGCSVVGVDISEELVTSARERAQEHAANAPRFLVTDGERVPVDTEVFDHVLLWSQLLGNVPGYERRKALLQECRRAVKPKARCSLSVHDLELTAEMARAKGMVVQQPGSTCLEAGDFILQDEPTAEPCYWHFFPREELVDLCESASFRVLDCRRAADWGQKNWNELWVCVCEAV